MIDPKQIQISGYTGLPLVISGTLTIAVHSFIINDNQEIIEKLPNNNLHIIIIYLSLLVPTILIGFPMLMIHNKLKVWQRIITFGSMCALIGLSIILFNATLGFILSVIGLITGISTVLLVEMGQLMNTPNKGVQGNGSH